MLAMERGLVSRILFPVPTPSYNVDCFPHELIWVPKTPALPAAEPEDPTVCPPIEDCVPCLLLTYPSARFLIIFFHSNAEDLGRCHGFCCHIRDQFQVHVLAVEYPGYGICPGVPCGETVMENALAAMKFVTDTLQWPMDSIKVFGRSIGTGPAVGLAKMFSLAGLILVTPFLSVQELFRDRVGPLAGFVEEWFPNSESAPQITSPTMIIHGQRDELIHHRHGESIYELLRPRKLLVSPPEMEHNTNLLTNLQFFVLPMFQFFALPDYAFQDLQIPPWAYDKRRSPYYIRPSIEISSHELPTSGGKKKMTVPAGDDGNVAIPSTVLSLSMPNEAQKAKPKPGGRDLAPMFSAKDTDSKKTSKVAPLAIAGPVAGPLATAASPLKKEKESSTTQAIDDGSQVAEEAALKTKGGSLFKNRIGASHSAVAGSNIAPPTVAQTDRSASSSGAKPSPSQKGGSSSSKAGVVPTTPRQVDDSLADFTPEARRAIQRLGDLPEKLNAREICSDELCVLEEKMDAGIDQNLRHQEKVLADFVRTHPLAKGDSPHTPKVPGRAEDWRGAFACGPQIWPAWCGKDPNRNIANDMADNMEDEVHRRTFGSPAPGLPPNEVGEDDLPQTAGMLAASRGGRQGTAASSTGLSRRSNETDDDEPASWETWAAAPGPQTPTRLKNSPVSPEAMLGGDGAGSADSGSHTEPYVKPISRSVDIIGGKGAKNPLWAACCTAVPSDALDSSGSPMPRPCPAPASNEEDPIVPFGGRVISGSHRPMSPEEVKLWRSYPLGTAAPPRRPFDEEIQQDSVPTAPVIAEFKRGTKFAI